MSGSERCGDSDSTKVSKSTNPFWQVRLEGACTINKVTVGARGNVFHYIIIFYDITFKFVCNIKE